MTSRAGSTPVLIGVGQHSERIGEPGYEGLSPVDLAARAARLALADAGITASEIDALACTRQFDQSIPGLPAALGRPDSFPGAVAARLEIEPARSIYAITGGQSPQQVVTELAGEIAAGRSQVALVVASEAISTVLSRAGQPDPPDFSETIGRLEEDRGVGLAGIVTRTHVTHRLTDAPTQYAIFENARRVRLGQSRAEQAEEMGRWFAPFTEVAAANPHADVRDARTPAELVAVTDGNRMIVDPYPKSLVAREKVNQSAAVLIASEEVAERLGVPREQWVYLRGHSDLRDRDLLRRPELSRSEPSVLAMRTALEMAGIGIDDVRTFDLYSCFPVAVSTVAEGLGLAPEDPRRLTVTGGLPFFGGPGNGYSLHAIVETVASCRRDPGAWGLVGANGGMLSKYSAGAYSTTPGPWYAGDDAVLQAGLDATQDVPVALVADGPATIESWTVKYQPEGLVAVVVGRLEDGRRFLANGDDGEADLLALLLGDDGPGASVFVRSTPGGNRVSLTERARTVPAPPYEYIQVDREDAVLLVTLVGTGADHRLPAAAHHELAAVFDGFEADPALRVAILTGSGDGVFCTGSDFDHPIAALDTNLPATGLAGLTERRLTKPVIAALNGNALGEAFEIAAACHLVVAEEQVEVGLDQVRRGLLAAHGGPARLLAALPAQVANRLLLTGGTLRASEAERWGLVVQVAPTGEGVKAARDLAAEIVRAAPAAVRYTLEAMAGAVDPAERLERLLVTSDAVEGFEAGMLGRDPVWRGI
ncbi:MAG TPA: enoyl-CoA hydratase-related protein [Marmoricola sp.]|jgi:acetyl-CoA C-acetyltransferase|nr:enoyl-CoA hydratase-related protein [Marmoricola sp.]